MEQEATQGYSSEDICYSLQQSGRSFSITTALDYMGASEVRLTIDDRHFHFLRVLDLRPVAYALIESGIALQRAKPQRSLADLEAEIERRELVWDYWEALAGLIDTPQFKRWNEHGPSLLALTRLSETRKAQAALKVLGEK